VTEWTNGTRIKVGFKVRCTQLPDHQVCHLLGVVVQQPALGQAHTVPRGAGHCPALDGALRGGRGGGGREEEEEEEKEEKEGSSSGGDFSYED